MKKGSKVRNLGIAALISTTFALPPLLEKQALAGDSGNSADITVSPLGDSSTVTDANPQATIDSLAPPEFNLAKLVPQVTLAKPTPFNLEGDAMMRYVISIENYKAFANSLFQPATYLKPLAEHLNSSRAWVYVKDQDGNPLQTFGTINNREQLKNLWFAIERGAAAPSHVYVDIWDRQTDTHFKSVLMKIRTE